MLSIFSSVCFLFLKLKKKLSFKGNKTNNHKKYLNNKFLILIIAASRFPFFNFKSQQLLKKTKNYKKFFEVRNNGKWLLSFFVNDLFINKTNAEKFIKEFRSRSQHLGEHPSSAHPKSCFDWFNNPKQFCWIVKQMCSTSSIELMRTPKTETTTEIKSKIETKGKEKLEIKQTKKQTDIL